MKTKLQIPPHPKARCYDVHELAAVVRIPKSTLYVLIDKGEFPRPLKVGRASLWRECDIIKWLDQQQAQQSTRR